MEKLTAYAIVGLGGRSRMYLDAFEKSFCAASRLVALCDSNAGRLELAAALPSVTPFAPRLYSANDFERMIAETKPDTVIVVCQDSFHDTYICRAMELGCDVITEKPMTIDAERAQRILDTQKRTGRKVRVTFNYRYSPPRTQVKDLLMSGAIGDVLSVDFQWMLDTVHGADYFRRWHRNKRNSGGLLVHKSTHHFDLVNWWLSAMPKEVVATGHRRFATPATAQRLGLNHPGLRCTDCADAQACPFYLDLSANEELNSLYRSQESHDGYHRDQCIFSPDIDIEDSMQALINYDNGVTLKYSLNAFCSWEGYTVQFNGTRGRLEHKCEETVYINGDGTVPGALKKEGTNIRIYPTRLPAYEVPVWTGEGGHGGGDDVMLRDLFAPEEADKYLRAADHRGGAASILCGIAANRSIAEGGWVKIDDIIHGLDRPDYPDMPAATVPFTLPLRA
jgi:predicted dehydrogenase